MNAFNNHTTTVAPVQPVSAQQLIASLVGELLAAGEILNTLQHYSTMAPLLHAMADLQGRGVIAQDLLRNRERKAVLDLAKHHNAQSKSIATPSGRKAMSLDLVRRLRTVAGQSIIKPPALDLEAASHIEQLELQLAALQPSTVV